MPNACAAAAGGLESEGIFRLAPDKDECDAVKAKVPFKSVLQSMIEALLQHDNIPLLIDVF